MSRLLIAHLSDIHVSTPSDPILAAAPAIARAIAVHAGASQQPMPNLLVVAITGDVAFSGSISQYDLATKFFGDLRADLGKTFANVAIVVTPGNHDLVLDPVDSLREMLLAGYDPNKLDERSFGAIAQVQTNFWSFAHTLTGAAPSTPVIAYESGFDLNGRTVRFRSVNTSWNSRLREEPATLEYPHRLLEEAVPAAAETDIVVTAFHHPYHWIREDEYRQFRAWVERHSDVVLTGHEHSPAARTAGGASTEQKLYVEAGALQFHGNADLDKSSFALVDLDLTKESYDYVSFVWSTAEGGYRTGSRSEGNRLRALAPGSRTTFPLTPDFDRYLDDVGEVFQHPRARGLRLSDIFVLPDIAYERNNKAAKSGSRSAPELVEDIVQEVRDTPRVLITGNELAGRTSLLKYLYRALHLAGYLPVYVDLATVQRDDLGGPRLRELISRQYRNVLDWEGYFQDLHSKGVALVDNFDTVAAGNRRNAVLSQLERMFNGVVVAGSGALSIPLGPDAATSPLWKYSALRILDLTHVRRGDLIKKWVMIGDDGEDSDRLSRDIVYRDALLSRIVRTNLLPSTPYFVLLALQQADVRTSGSDVNTSYGHLYHASLTMAIERAHTYYGPDVLLDYMTAFAEELHGRLGNGLGNPAELLIPEAEFREWHKDFWAPRGVELRLDIVLQDLVGARIFSRADNYVGFRYKNAYYYSLARFFSQRDDAAVESVVSELVENLHLEQSYVAVMFLAHLDHRTTVIRSLLQASRRVLHDALPTCLLQSGGALMSDLAELPTLPLPTGTFAEKRRAILAEMDGVDAHGGAHDEEKQSSGAAGQSTADVTRELNSGVRMVHVLGQVLRRHGATPNLSGDLKREIVQECYDLSLRVLARFFGILGENAEDVRKGLLYFVVHSGRADVKDSESLRKAVALMLNQSVLASCVGVVASASDALGTELLRPTYSAVAAANESHFSYRAVDLAIALDLETEMPIKRIKDVVALANRASSVLGEAVLARLVWSAMRRYVYTPRELHEAAAITRIGHATPSLMNPGTKKTS